MAITIKDVAARAGVSVTTVSKILNRRPGISEETTQRVEQVMRELEYAPNSRAASLARRATRNIIYLTSLAYCIGSRRSKHFCILMFSAFSCHEEIPPFAQKGYGANRSL